MATQLGVEEVFCHICQGILVQPVRLPCRHVFCLQCFNASMGETSYSCPLCRLRVSNWVRSARKAGSLIDKTLWDRIQKYYQHEIDEKLAGRDDGLISRLQVVCQNYPIISSTGEVEKEYKHFLRSHQEDIKKQREKEERESIQLIEKLKEEERQQEKIKNARSAEERMSLELIKKLQEEEENERRQQEKKSLELIKILQEEDKKTRSRSSNVVSLRSLRSRRNAQAGKSKSSGKASVGPMDQFTTRTLKQTERVTQSEQNSDSRDSIVGEYNSHFKPIRSVPKTPPKTKTAIYHPNKRTPNAFKSFDFEPKAPHSLVQSPWSAFCPKKQDSVLKEISENSDSNSFTDGEIAGKCAVQSAFGSENQMSAMATTSSD